MVEVVQGLLIVQDRDRRVSQLQAEQERLPKEAAAIDARLASEKSALEAHRDAVRRIEAERKKLEIDADSKRNLIARYKGQQLQTRKNEEYSALEHEIAREEAAIEAIEDRELELMEQYEKGQQDLKAEEANARQYEAKAKEDHAKLETRSKNLEAELATALAAQAEARGAVHEAHLTLYERLRKTKGDTAIVPLNAGACGGCHMKLTTQTANRAKAGSSIVQCDSCGRILYGN